MMHLAEKAIIIPILNFDEDGLLKSETSMAGRCAGEMRHIANFLITEQALTFSLRGYSISQMFYMSYPAFQDA
jgi:hypothetical protein